MDNFDLKKYLAENKLNESTNQKTPKVGDTVLGKSKEDKVILGSIIPGGTYEITGLTSTQVSLKPTSKKQKQSPFSVSLSKLNQKMEDGEIILMKESLNENFVGLGMVGNIFDRPKADYELAYEHYLGKLHEGDDREMEEEDEDYSDYFFDIDTPEEGVEEGKEVEEPSLYEEVGADGEENPIDSITMDVPLFIRMLEFAREDASTDMDLHDVAEKATALSAEGEILSMDNYESIVGRETEELDEVGHFKYTSKRGYGDKKVGTYLGKYPIYQDDEGNNYIKTGSGIKDVEDLDQSKVKINN